METHKQLAHTWNRRPGWTAANLDGCDPRLVAAVVDPGRDAPGHWRSELEALEFRLFRERGFVRDLDEHRGIYDPVLVNTQFVAVAWAPTATVLSVCRLMFSDPAVPLPVLAAVEAGCMQVDDIPAVAAARTRRAAAVEATIVTVPPAERPAGVPSPTEVCHGLFMAATATRPQCEWILSAVDPGALTRAHVNARAGHLIESVGSGEDTAGIVSEVVALAIADVLGWLAVDPASTVCRSLEFGRDLMASPSVDHAETPRAA